MLVGEQPGDYEDVAGRPFVGPAGKIMDRALEEAGIDRSHVYVTNAVKHFKWEPRGKRRIHQKPNAREIAACRPWLEAEMRLVKPQLVICLGSTAGQLFFGPSFRVTRERGKVLSSKLAPKAMAAVHPSSCFGSRTKNRANVNTTASLSIFALPYRQPAKLENLRGRTVAGGFHFGLISKLRFWCCRRSGRRG